MFKRKKSKTTIKRIRDLIYPDMGIYRSVKYTTNRMKRIKGNPYFVSAGFACGVAMSFTPFLGLHFLLSALLALIIRGSLFASVIGTFVGNPLTFPFIFSLIYNTGKSILGTAAIAEGKIIETTLNGIVGLFKFFILFVQDYQRAVDNWDTYGPQVIGLWQLVSPMLLGALIWSILMWFISFTIIYRFVNVYHKRKRERQKKKIQKQLDGQK